MADRQITNSRKDNDGDITAICNPGEWWSPKFKSEAINEIKTRTHRYFVKIGSKKVDIHVAGTPPNEYLRTDRDESPENNLDNLPNC